MIIFPANKSELACPTSRIRQIYYSPRLLVGWQLGVLVKHERIRYLGYARDALHLALAGMGLGSGDSILLPAFICRDVLPSLSAVGVVPVYYTVDRSLQPAIDFDSLPPFKAVLVVNYFGFAQDLEPFRTYCKKSGAVLIEDNAHGLLSCDAGAHPLGTRGDVGLFSLRKTLPLQDGAALVVNDAALAARLNLPEISGSTATSWRWRLKRLARALVPIVGVRGLRVIIAAGRVLRDSLSRRNARCLQMQTETERRPTSPYADFQRDLARTDPVAEVSRRRELYQWLHEYLHEAPCTPIFGALDAHTVPYGYPFHAEPKNIPQIRRRLVRVGLDCFLWPDLPDEVRATMPDWYKNIWCVQFLW